MPVCSPTAMWGSMRYFFHVEDGVSVRDHHGTELAGLEQARLEALSKTVRLISVRDKRFWRGHGWKMTVTDDRDHTLFILNFMAVSGPLSDRYDLRFDDEWQPTSE